MQGCLVSPRLFNPYLISHRVLQFTDCCYFAAGTNPTAVSSLQPTITTPATAQSTTPSEDSSSGGGMSLSDKIALGTGIGFGIPAVIIGILGLY
jgi:hypothetical protein